MLEAKYTTNDEIVGGALKLISMGARNVIVSLGKDGAILVTEDKDVMLVKAPTGKALNTVGAGDSLVAGFIDEYSVSKDIKKAFIKGVASGSATALSENLATYEEVEKMMKKLK